VRSIGRGDKVRIKPIDVVGYVVDYHNGVVTIEDEEGPVWIDVPEDKVDLIR
jgi:hypothetical protein